MERRVFLDPGQDFIATGKERVEVALFPAVNFLEDAECVAAVVAVGCPFLHLAWIEGCLSAGNGGAGRFCGFSSDGVGAVGNGEIVVKREPQTGAGSGGTSGDGNFLLIEIPFVGFAADELQCAGCIVQAGFDWRLDSVGDGFFDESIFYGND